MKIRDIMTTNVVTVSSDTSITDAGQIMRAHKIERLPIVDRGKLVGVVTKDDLLRVSPSPATSLSIHEITYLLSKMKVKDVMKKDVVTAKPDMTVESAVALAQGKKVGSLPVVEDGRVVGIVTTNDFFYKILNPLLGIGEPGTRIKVNNCAEVKDIVKVYDVISKHNVKIITAGYIPHAEHGMRDLTIHIDVEDVSKIVKEMSDLGYTVEIRER
ncbi:CBS domain-containing protein [Chloroflexota bacterium]